MTSLEKGLHQAPSVLGRFRLVCEIGVGGMGSVHLARSEGPGGFEKWVAIEIVHEHLGDVDLLVQMFLDEARVAARIPHPNVASVFELGQDGSTYWIAMEYLHGETLHDVVRRTEERGLAIPISIACRIIADAADGLHAAHELRADDGEPLCLVHRDVSPHNLFVTYDGVTKIVDFGIAKFSSRVSTTKSGELRGKVAYMPPEQLLCQPLDRRTDVFALGIALWETTTGKRLFRQSSDLETLAKVYECNVPPPSTVVEGYPPALEAIVLRALARDRKDRYATAREMSRALQGFLQSRGILTTTEEIATFLRNVFGERIARRNASLRAAEATGSRPVLRSDSDPPRPVPIAKTGWSRTLLGSSASAERDVAVILPPAAESEKSHTLRLASSPLVAAHGGDRATPVMPSSMRPRSEVNPTPVPVVASFPARDDAAPLQRRLSGWAAVAVAAASIVLVGALAALARHADIPRPAAQVSQPSDPPAGYALPPPAPSIVAIPEQAAAATIEAVPQQPAASPRRRPMRPRVRKPQVSAPAATEEPAPLGTGAAPASADAPASSASLLEVPAPVPDPEASPPSLPAEL